MIRSIILGLFAIWAVNYGVTGNQGEVSDDVLENAEALIVNSPSEACSSCDGAYYAGCSEVVFEGDEIVVIGCRGQKIEEE